MSQTVAASPLRLLLNEQPTVSGTAGSVVVSFTATGCATRFPGVVGAETLTATKPSIAAKKTRKLRMVVDLLPPKDISWHSGIKDGFTHFICQGLLVGFSKHSVRPIN